MKVCFLKMNTRLCVATALLFWTERNVAGFVIPESKKQDNCNVMKLFGTEEPTQVQVCGFKDCKRNGGGIRLESFINSVRS
jgi:hypothetical protein